MTLSSGHITECSAPVRLWLTFGLLHTVEKSAEILVKVMSMAPRKLQTITPDDFRAVAKDFHVTLPEEFLYEKEQ